MGIRFSPCGCCGTECPQITEDFARADSTTVGANWSEDAGNWEIVSGKVQVATADAELSNFGASSAGWFTAPAGSFSVSAKVRGTADGDVLLLGYVANDLGAAAGFAGFIRLVLGASGSLQLVSDVDNAFPTEFSSEYTVNAPANQDHTIKLVRCSGFNSSPSSEADRLGCGKMLAYLNGELAAVWSMANEVGGVDARVQVVLATGSTLTGTAYFDDVTGSTLEPANELQTIQLSATGGTFQIEIWRDSALYGTTAAIAYNAIAATIQTSIEAVIGAGNVSCTGGPVNAATVSVEFQGAWEADNIDTMVGLNAGLTGGTGVITITNIRRGEDCIPCAGCCYRPLDATNGAAQILLTMAGFTGGEAVFNGSYFLDPTADDCAGYSTPSHTCCACYEGVCNIDYGGTPVTRVLAYPMPNGFGGHLRRVRIAFVAGIQLDSVEASPPPVGTLEHGGDEVLQLDASGYGAATATLEPA